MKTLSYNNLELSFTDRGRLCCLSQNGDRITGNRQDDPYVTLVIDGKEITDITLHVFGKHNVYNSLSAIAAATELGIEIDAIKAGLLHCKGAERRFEYKGTILDNVKVMDDYAHHPTEIAATLAAAKNTDYHELWCVFQPHTYTRTKALLPELSLIHISEPTRH